MLDIKLIRNNPVEVKKQLEKRNTSYDKEIDEIISIDSKRREINSQSEALKAKQNLTSKEIPRLRKQGEDLTPLLEQMKSISEQVKQLDATLAELEQEQQSYMLGLPNIPHTSVPIGKDDSENVEIRRFMHPTELGFPAKAHWDIGDALGILDNETAAKVTGTRFYFYKGAGARLERSIINFFLNTHIANGYTEVFPPFMVNRSSMTGTGQLPKFEQDAFKVCDTDYFLIPTAEVPVTNMHRDQILDFSNLPLKYCAYSACFRAEAGSAGHDTRGLIRQHQFNKVELVKFSQPDTSYEELEGLTQDAEQVLKLLELPYRVVALSTGDLGFSSAKTYDIEVWMPSYNRFVEISSCSNFEDFQARRAAIRFKRNVKDKAQLIHTLNGSGVAVGRTVAAILENYQNKDGSVTVPEVLRSYMGVDIIK